VIKIVAYNDNGDEIGSFYIPDGVSKEWVERNIPPIIRAIQLLAGKIEKIGY